MFHNKNLFIFFNICLLLFFNFPFTCLCSFYYVPWIWTPHISNSICWLAWIQFMSLNVTYEKYCCKNCLICIIINIHLKRFQGLIDFDPLDINSQCRQYITVILKGKKLFSFIEFYVIAHFIYIFLKIVQNILPLTHHWFFAIN